MHSFRDGKICIKKNLTWTSSRVTKQTQYLKKALNHKKNCIKKCLFWQISVAKYLKSESKPSDSLALIKLVIDKISLQHTTPKTFNQHRKANSRTVNS
jgi:hypothetical protein